MEDLRAAGRRKGAEGRRRFQGANTSASARARAGEEASERATRGEEVREEGSGRDAGEGERQELDGARLGEVHEHDRGNTTGAHREGAVLLTTLRF